MTTTPLLQVGCRQSLRCAPQECVVKLFELRYDDPGTISAGILPGCSPQSLLQFTVRDQTLHGGREGLHVARWNQESSLAIADHFWGAANPRANYWLALAYCFTNDSR